MFVNQDDVPGVLTAQQIQAAVTLVENACKDESNGKKVVYQHANGIMLNSLKLKDVLDHEWVSDRVSSTVL